MPLRMVVAAAAAVRGDREEVETLAAGARSFAEMGAVPRDLLFARVIAAYST